MRTLAQPAGPARVVHRAVSASITVRPEHAVPPTVTEDACVKFVPRRVISVPPAVVPDAGSTDVREG
jgi:hypothetical protein